MDTTLKDYLFVDLERELAVTRKVLERLPPEHYKWKPHEKSMSLQQLALHVATIPDWARGTLANDVLDVANAPRPPQSVKDRAELLALFDASAAAFDASKLNLPWSMKNGTEVIVSRPRSIVYRAWCMNHLIHHRAQLCLYLRLLNVPVPTVYFNTADDPTWQFD